MGVPSEDHLARTLAIAVENSAASDMRDLQAVQERLDDFLYHCGGDVILDLSVSEAGPTRIVLLGIVIWVETQTLAPIEAEFDRDPAEGAVTAFTVRAGDGRTSRRDAPSYPIDSWRKRLRIVEGRPTVDDDWEYVLRSEFA